MTTKTLTNFKSRVLALVLTIAALAAGQRAWATVTGTGTENDPFVVDSWADLKEKMAAGGYIRLDADVTDRENTNTSYLNVPAGISVTLDLNGHKIDRNLTEASNDGHVIQVKGMETNLGSLTIRDSQGGGTITGGFTSSGGGAGGIYVYFGNLTLEGGSIRGNKCTGYGGGGIRLAGSGSTFTMTGGSITGNVANTGKNSEAECGGAIFFYGSGEVHISGGSITDNYCHATNYGCAGIGGYTNTTTHTEKTYLSGTYTLSGNLKGTYDEVNGVWTNPVASDYMHGKYDDIYISGVISPTAATAFNLYNSVGFSWTTRPRLTNNWATHMGYTDADDYFTLVANDESSGKVIGVRDGNLYIGTPEAALWHADDDHDGSTADKAYIISTPKGLDLLASQVNGTDGYTANDFSGKHFKLGNDITYTHKAANEAGADTENNFTAIGSASNLFKGTFNGQNHTISGIRIYQPNADFQGLFGIPLATIQNVILTDAKITGANCTGGIAGANNGEIDNCIVRDAVITGNNMVGGITGLLGSGPFNIKGCFVDGINVSGNYAGAIVGSKTGDPTLQNNYYHDCTRTIGNNTATTGIGVYNGDVTENNGARAVFTITAGPNVSFTATAAFAYQDVNYYFRDNAVTLNYTGNTPATGYKPSFSYTDGQSVSNLAGNTFYMPPSDITVNVAIVPITYTVRFNKNHVNATGTMDDQNFTYDAAQNLTICSFRRTGYTFAGWTTNADGTGDSYTDGQEVSNLTATDGNAVTLYAQWTDHWNIANGADGTTAETAYVINSTTGLDLLAKQVNGTDGYTANDFSGTFFKLGNGIAYTGSLTPNPSPTGEGNYTAIGTASHPFKGIFDGNGMIVSGICINQGTADYQGLFGYVGTGGTVQNVILTEATITGHENTTGAIAGYNEGTLTANYYRGCTVNSQTTNVGTGNGDVTGARSVHALTFSKDGITTTTPPAVTDNGIGYYTAGTEVTLNYNGNVPTGYVFAYMVNGSAITGNCLQMPAADVSVGISLTDLWGVSGSPAADGSLEHPYLIGTPAGLDLLASYVNGSTGSPQDFAGKHFRQTAPITYTGTANNYTPIGNNSHHFCGHYDGDGNTISGIRINSSDDYQGLFGEIGAGAEVQNVILANAQITGAVCTGGIVGRTDGATISGCVVKDDVTIGYATGNVTCHGGIVGNIINGGLVIGCVSKATINGSDSNTNGNELFGGIAGQNNGGTIRDCLYTGSTVQGKQYIGAIVGNSSGGTLTNNYYTSSTVPCGVNSNDQNGARRAWTVTLGEDVVLVGDETAYVSGITAIGSGNYALSYNDGTTATLYSGEGQTLTLYYTGDISGHILSYSYNDGSEHAIDGNSFTMPGANVSVSAILTPVYALTFDEDGITTTTPPAVTDNGIGYYAAGTEIILDYIIPTGYDFRNFRRDGYLVGNSFTMPSQDVTVSVYKTPQWGINNGKDGSQAKPYVISDLYDLNVLAMSVNGTDGAAHYVANDFEGKYFQVDKDISYDEKTENNFTAIGTASHPFKGTFDGNNKVVKNIRINRGDDDYQGLFGYVGTGGTVQNVIVEAAIIAGKSHTGAIAGYNEGTLSANYYLDSEVNTAAVNVGTGSGDVTGALSMHMIIPGEGVVVSGSVHFYILTFSSSFDTGDDYYAQGSTVTLSPAEGYLLGSGGYTVTKEGTNETVAVTETETAGVYTFTMPACKVIVSPIVPDIATYWHADTDHDGTSEERAYIISTTTGLNMLANHVYDGHDCKGLFFRLGADIAYDPSAADANGINFLGIGGDYGTGVGMFFNGTFDGQGYTISGTRIHRTADNVGLFGAIGSGGTVKNVTLTDARITGGNSTGGIAGSNTGTIKNCIVVGTTIIKEYRDHYGVIVGMNSGIISNNYYLGCTYIDGNNSKTSSIGLGDNDEDFDYSGHDQDDDDGALETEAFPLLSSGNNDRAISKYNGVANQDFTLAGRTLYKDGDWNTLCLPFSLSAEQIAAHEYFKDVDIRAFSSASFSNGTLTLNFTAQGDVTSIQAGTPYIIKWTKADDYDEGYNHAIYDIRNGTFKKVTITSTTPGAVTSAGGKVTFQGTYSYIQYTNEDRSVLFLGTQNKLYWPLPALFDPTKPYDELWNPWVYPNIGAFRAYFQLNGLTAGDPNAPGLNIVLNFGETTSLSEKGIVNSEKFATAEEWYTVNGVKLSGKPTQKGVYIFGNKQVVIK